METSPGPAFSQPSSDAVVWMFSISIATEPATPTAPPPAPLVADAPSLFCACVIASMVAPFALTVLSGGAHTDRDAGGRVAWRARGSTAARVRRRARVARSARVPRRLHRGAIGGGVRVRVRRAEQREETAGDHDDAV